MRIVEARELTVPLQAPIANSVVNFGEHTVSLVALISDVERGGRPVVGTAFNSIGRFGQSGILRERVFPRLHSAAAAALLDDETGELDPSRVAAEVMSNEKPGGHGDRSGAVAAVELAAWDLKARLADEPVWLSLRRAVGQHVDKAKDVPTYAAGGYYHDRHSATDDLSALEAELTSYRRLGYTACKIKIGGAPVDHDRRRIDTAIAVFDGPERVAVDANGRFDASGCEALCRALSGLHLRWLEEPCDPLDFKLLNDVRQSYDGALATGENLFSHQDVANLLRYSGLDAATDVLQMDPGLSYGVTELLKMLNVMESNSFPRQSLHPHGGQLLNLHVVAGLGLGGTEAYPGVFQPVSGFGTGVQLRDGKVSLPQSPGFGLELVSELAPYLNELLS